MGQVCDVFLNTVINKPPNDCVATAKGVVITADRNPVRLRSGKTHSAEPCSKFNDLLQHGALHTILMDENNHSDSDDSEQSS